MTIVYLERALSLQRFERTEVADTTSVFFLDAQLFHKQCWIMRELFTICFTMMKQVQKMNTQMLIHSFPERIRVPFF